MIKFNIAVALTETQINIMVKDTFDSQLNEYATDMLSLIKDAKDKIETQIDKIEAKITSSITAAQNSGHTACNATANTPRSANSYTATLINPPPPPHTHQPQIGRQRRYQGTAVCHVEQQNLHKAVACHTLSLPLLFTEVLVLQVLRMNPSEVY